MGVIMGAWSGRWLGPEALDPQVEAEMRTAYMNLLTNLEVQQAQYSTHALQSHAQLQVAAYNSLANMYGAYANLAHADAANRQAHAAMFQALRPVMERTIMDRYGIADPEASARTATAAAGLSVKVSNAVQDQLASGALKITEGYNVSPAFEFGLFVASATDDAPRRTLENVVASQRAQGRPTTNLAIEAESQMRKAMLEAAFATEERMGIPVGTLSSTESINTAMYSAGFSQPVDSGGNPIVMVGGQPFPRDQFLASQAVADLPEPVQARLKQPLIPTLQKLSGESPELLAQRMVEGEELMRRWKGMLQQGPATAEKRALIASINQLEADISELGTDPSYMAQRLAEMPMLHGIENMKAQVQSQLEYLSMSRDPVEQKINQLYGEFGQDFMKSYAMVAFDGALRQPSVEDVTLDLQTLEGQQRLIQAHQIWNNAPNLYENDPYLYWQRLQENGIPINGVQRKTGMGRARVLETKQNMENLDGDKLLGSDKSMAKIGNLLPAAYRTVLPGLAPPVEAAPSVPAPAVAVEPAVPAAPVDYLEDEDLDADIVIRRDVEEGMPEWFPPAGEAYTLKVNEEDYFLASNGEIEVFDEEIGMNERVHPDTEKELHQSILQNFEAAAAEGQFEYQPPQSLKEVEQRIREGESFTSQEVAAARGEAPAEEVVVDMPQVEATPEDIMGLDEEPKLRDRVAARQAAREERREEADPLLERAIAAAKRTAVKLREPDFEAPTKMRHRGAYEAGVHPPKPKKVAREEPPARRKAPPKKAAPTGVKKEAKKPSAAEEHKAEVEEIEEEYGPGGQQPTTGIWGDMQKQYEAGLEGTAQDPAGPFGKSDLPGPSDTPPGKKVSLGRVESGSSPTR